MSAKEGRIEGRMEQACAALSLTALPSTVAVKRRQKREISSLSKTKLIEYIRYMLVRPGWSAN